MLMRINVSCDRQAILEACRRCALAKANLDAKFVDVSCAWPGGAYMERATFHEFKDYFESVTVGEISNGRFSIDYVRRDTVPSSYWRDLVVKLEMELERMGAKAAIDESLMAGGAANA